MQVASWFIFPQSKEGDILYTLLITDEVITNDDDKPCLQTDLINDFNSYHPIFGAIFIDESNDTNVNDTLLPLFLESLDCLIDSYSNGHSVIETNSTVAPSESFTSFYGFIDDIDINNLNMNANSCDTMVNITWPAIDFDYFIPLDGLYIISCFNQTLSITDFVHDIIIYRLYWN